MKLCLNCFGSDQVTGFPVGHDQGSQRDSYRVSLLLCEECRLSLMAGDLAKFHERYLASRLITR